MRLSLFITAGLFYLLISCTPEFVHPETYKGESISFGRGGGFTGRSDQYVLTDKGYLYQTNVMQDTFIQIIKLKRQTQRKLWQMYNDLKLDEMDINQPGNSYYFIRKYTGSKQHLVQWGSNESRINPDVQNYFDLLFSLRLISEEQ